MKFLGVSNDSNQVYFHFQKLICFKVDIPGKEHLKKLEISKETIKRAPFDEKNTLRTVKSGSRKIV
jgi:hypothetical protein